MISFTPTLPSWGAGLFCVVSTVFFVCSLYVFPIAGANKTPTTTPATAATATATNVQDTAAPMNRDHPLVIQQRMKGIALSSVLIPVSLGLVLGATGAIPAEVSFWSQLGLLFRLIGLSVPCFSVVSVVTHMVVPLLLVAILFMGPLLMLYIDQELPFQPRQRWIMPWQEEWDLISTRNYIVGPISEEFIFRGCLIAIAACSGASLTGMVFGLPLVFGIAHLHHAYEAYVKRGRTRQALLQAVVIVLVQFTYTNLFGWFACFLFLRTSSLLAPCICHTFCNLMGFPEVSNIQYYGPWRRWIIAAFVSGMVLFGILLGPMTHPPLYGDGLCAVYWPVVTTVRQE